ncbi:MAG: DMT family transporter [Myxococcales bacterium]|jgi:drug/metabolite transporter (DMT)-like permease
MMTYAGPLAALATALCWSTNSVLFTLAGRRVGSPTVNIARPCFALVAMVGLHTLLLGTPFPADDGERRFVWLGISGLIGFALGDAVLFESFVRLGPRLAMLIMTLWPIFATVLAWIFLGERLGLAHLAAMAATLGGIAWVVSDKPSGEGLGPRKLASGVLLAVGGALGQAVGFLFSRFGLEGGFHPVSANLLRVLAATLALGGWMLLRGQLLGHLGKLRDRTAFGLIAVGAAAGPVAGVVLSLYAQSHAPQGVAATLMSVSPVILLPVSAALFGERITGRAIAGTLLTVGGAAVLFLL